MNLFVSIVKQIFYISIITMVFVGIMPNEKYQKIMKMLCGFILMMVLMNPLLKLCNLKEIFESTYEKIIGYDTYSTISIYQKDSVEKQENQNNELVEACKQEIEKNIEKIVIENGKYPVKTIVDIETDEKKDSFGKIVSVSLVISGSNKEELNRNTDIKIEAIQVGQVDQQDLSELDASGNQILNEISEFYEMNADHVHIRIQK